ncbi:MAG: hypothetical protein V4592_24810 [Bacteroidota bacterium]
MKFKLNTWQTIAHFFPFFVASVLMMRLHFGKPVLLIANVLMVFDMALVHAYQVYLANSFNQQQSKPSMFYKFNLFIPLVGLVLYFLDVLRGSIMSPGAIEFGPMRGLRFNWYMDTLYAILIYAGINYFFFNVYFAAKQLKTVTDADKKEELTTNYLGPMRQLVRISLWSLVAGFAISCMADIITLFKM